MTPRVMHSGDKKDFSLPLEMTNSNSYMAQRLSRSRSSQLSGLRGEILLTISSTKMDCEIPGDDAQNPSNHLAIDPFGIAQKKCG